MQEIIMQEIYWIVLTAILISLVAVSVLYGHLKVKEKRKDDNIRSEYYQVRCSKCSRCLMHYNKDDTLYCKYVECFILPPDSCEHYKFQESPDIIEIGIELDNKGA